jgi:hypothetical protein
MPALLGDIGVPMIAVYWPLAWLALVPVIFIEALVARRSLHVGWSSALGSTTAANVLTILLGIPLVWLAWALIEMRFFAGPPGTNHVSDMVRAVTLQAPWLPPYDRDLFWMMPLAALTLTVVFFFMSVAVEWLMMRVIYRANAPREVRRWAWQANLLSYVVLLAIVCTGAYFPKPALDRVADRPVNFMLRSATNISRWLAGPRAPRQQPQNATVSLLGTLHSETTTGDDHSL